MLARDPGSCQPPAPGDTVWCDWDVEVEGVVEEEQPFYLPLQDDEGNPLPIGPPWALRARREQDEQAGGEEEEEEEDGTPRGDAKRQRRSVPAASPQPEPTASAQSVQSVPAAQAHGSSHLPSRAYLTRRGPRGVTCGHVGRRVALGAEGPGA